MQIARNFWKAFRNFAILFSFIMNFVLIVILLVVVREIFIIKNGIAEPLIDGLHRNFVGMDQAHIKTVIPVNDTITIDFELPIEQETTVVLTERVVLGQFSFGEQQLVIALNEGQQLPVRLNMIVPVQQEIPIALNVDVDIPLDQTELHQPFVNLRNLFEPFVRSLDNLPQDWDEVPDFALDAVQGNVNLMNETEGSRNPWQTPTPGGEDTVTEGTQPSTGGEPVGTGGAATPTPFPTTEPGAPTATTVPLIQEAELTTPTPTETPQG